MSRKFCSTEVGWRHCCRCPLHESRRHVVQRGYGSVQQGCVDREGINVYWNGEPTEKPTEALIGRPRGPFLLFLGIAPGRQEDITRIPFQGEQGRILNLALSLCKTRFSFEISYIVQCRPTKKGKWDSIVNRPPTTQEIETCLPHVEELVAEIDYDATIQLGEIPYKIPKKPSLKLRQPADILKKEYKFYDLREFAMKLDNFVETLVCGKDQK